MSERDSFWLAAGGRMSEQAISFSFGAHPWLVLLDSFTYLHIPIEFRSHGERTSEREINIVVGTGLRHGEFNCVFPDLDLLVKLLCFRHVVDRSIGIVEISRREIHSTSS